MQLWGAHIGIDQQDPAAALAGQNFRQIRGYECFAFRRVALETRRILKGYSRGSDRAGSARCGTARLPWQTPSSWRTPGNWIGIPDGFDTFGPQLVELEYLGIFAVLESGSTAGARTVLASEPIMTA